MATRLKVEVQLSGSMTRPHKATQLADTVVYPDPLLATLQRTSSLEMAETEEGGEHYIAARTVNILGASQLDVPMGGEGMPYTITAEAPYPVGNYENYAMLFVRNLSNSKTLVLAPLGVGAVLPFLTAAASVTLPPGAFILVALNALIESAAGFKVVNAGSGSADVEYVVYFT